MQTRVRLCLLSSSFSFRPYVTRGGKCVRRERSDDGCTCGCAALSDRAVLLHLTSDRSRDGSTRKDEMRGHETRREASRGRATRTRTRSPVLILVLLLLLILVLVPRRTPLHPRARPSARSRFDQSRGVRWQEAEAGSLKANGTPPPNCKWRAGRSRRTRASRPSAVLWCLLETNM